MPVDIAALDLPQHFTKLHAHWVAIAARRAFGVNWEEAVAGMPLSAESGRQLVKAAWWPEVFGYFQDLRLRGQLLPELRDKLLSSVSRVLDRDPQQVESTKLIAAWDRAAMLTGAYSAAQKGTNADPAEDNVSDALLLELQRTNSLRAHLKGTSRS